MSEAVTVPNALTMARIALAPVLAVALLADGATAAALIVFAAGMATDVFDGQLARSRQLVSNFGKLMDPIADKLFIGTAFVCLAASDRIAIWVIVVVLARELIVTALRLVARREGVIIAAGQLGKAKTVIQAIAVFVLIAAAPAAAGAQVLVYLMVAITVVSGIDYVASFTRGRLAQRRPAEPIRAAA